MRYVGRTLAPINPARSALESASPDMLRGMVFALSGNTLLEGTKAGTSTSYTTIGPGIDTTQSGSVIDTGKYLFSRGAYTVAFSALMPDFTDNLFFVGQFDNSGSGWQGGFYLVQPDELYYYVTNGEFAAIDLGGTGFGGGLALLKAVATYDGSLLTLHAEVGGQRFTATHTHAQTYSDSLTFKVAGGWNGNQQAPNITTSLIGAEGVWNKALVDEFLADPFVPFRRRRRWVPVSSGGGDISGSAAQTLPAITQSASAELIFTASADQTLASLTQSAEGTNGFSGSAAQTLPSITQDAAGDLTFSGTSNQLLAAINQSASGGLTFEGAAAQTLAAIVQSAEGTSGSDRSGTIAQTLPVITQDGSGTLAFEATSTSTLPAIIQSAQETVAVTAQVRSGYQQIRRRRR